jgi:hypothetical protein
MIIQAAGKKLSLLSCWLVLVLLLAITIAGGKWSRHKVIKSDAAGYYAYLSSGIVYHDLLKVKFYWQVDSLYDFADGVPYYAVQYYPQTQNFYFKYNYGVALLELPLFLAAHTLTLLTHQYPADGYSAYYQLSVALSTVLFGFLGLLVLRRLLLCYFSDSISAITLLLIGLGTNFFAQAITQPGLSHIYQFFLFALILYSTKRLYETYSWKHTLLLGTALALAIIIRPADIFICLFPLLWKATDAAFTAQITTTLKNHKVKILSVFAIIAVAAFIQMAYWKVSTGHWYIYTYKREHFNFGNWQLLNGLFSFRKGWFIYTPLAITGFIGAGVIYRRNQLRFYLLPFALYFALTLYVVFCWWQWFYGGSFGCRALIESLAVLALPMAAFVNAVLNSKQALRIGIVLILAFFVLLNQFQTVQYAKGIIHWQKMNREYYWRVFGKLQVNDADKELLKQTEEWKP